MWKIVIIDLTLAASKAATQKWGLSSQVQGLGGFVPQSDSGFGRGTLHLAWSFVLNLFANCHVSFTPLLTQIRNKPALPDEWQAIIGYLVAYLRKCLHDS